MIVDFEGQVCAAFAAAATTALASMTPPPQVALFGSDTDLLSTRVELNAEVTGVGEDPTDAQVYRYMRKCVLYAGVIVLKMDPATVGEITTRVRNLIELSHLPASAVNTTLLTHQLSVTHAPMQTGMQRSIMEAGELPLLQVIMTYEFPLFYNYQPPTGD